MTRRVDLGLVIGFVCLAIATVSLLPERSHVSVATDALVLVVPVLISVAIGGFGVGVACATAGFLIYDWFFIPPFGTFTVGSLQNWVALAVYVVVVLIVSRIVASLRRSRDVAQFRERAIRRVFVVTQQLISARPIDELLELIASSVQRTFVARWVALLLPDGDNLRIAAVAGDSLSTLEHEAVLSVLDTPQALALTSQRSEMTRLALATDRSVVGQIVIAGAQLTTLDRELLGTFANQAALALERSQLRDAATHAEVLEEVDRWRSALMGAASHDLRTPLASMKTSVSLLRSSNDTLSNDDQSSLLELIEDQCDHLSRLVGNLLDGARIESGSLALHREPQAVADILELANQSVGRALTQHSFVVNLPRELPLVDADAVLIAQVVANLLVNAAQNSPIGSTITFGATAKPHGVVLMVSDEGTGVATTDRERIFHMMDRRAGSGRAGLGLSLSRSFVEAHGEQLSVASAPGGGAEFSFTLPVSNIDESVE